MAFLKKSKRKTKQLECFFQRASTVKSRTLSRELKGWAVKKERGGCCCWGILRCEDPGVIQIKSSAGRAAKSLTNKNGLSIAWRGWRKLRGEPLLHTTFVLHKGWIFDSLRLNLDDLLSLSLTLLTQPIDFTTTSVLSHPPASVFQETGLIATDSRGSGQPQPVLPSHSLTPQQHLPAAVAWFWGCYC